MNWPLPPIAADLPSPWPELWTAALTLCVVYVLWQALSFREFMAETGARIVLAGSVAARVLHLPKRRRWLLQQLNVSGLRNLHVVLLVGLFIGMILSLQTGIELARFGQQDQIGPLVASAMAREMGPFITAVILAATVGSAMAAELGTMSVSDELSALEVLSVDRTSFLVVPRVAGLMILCPMLTVVCDTIGILGGGFVANAQLGVGWQLYFDSALASLAGVGEVIPIPKDVYGGLLKAVVFGGIVSIISCASGLEARGGALGVGRATSRAVRDSIIAVIVANYFLTWVLYQGGAA